MYNKESHLLTLTVGSSNNIRRPLSDHITNRLRMPRQQPRETARINHLNPSVPNTLKFESSTPLLASFAILHVDAACQTVMRFFLMLARIWSSVATSKPGKLSVLEVRVEAIARAAKTARARLNAAMATCWSTGEESQLGRIAGRSEVSALFSVTLPSETGATMATSSDANVGA